MSTGTAVRSPLHDTHVALGAAFTDFAGWSMPIRYGSELAEHAAVRDAAGLFDLSHMGEIHVEGPEAATALDRALVGNLSALAPGRARYTMLCAPDGGVLDDLVVYRLTETSFMVVANASNRVRVAEELGARAAGLEADVLDRSRDTALIAVQGPASAAIVESATGTSVDGLRYYASMPARIGEDDILLARTGYTGEDGFEIYLPAGRATATWQHLSEVGAVHQLVPAGLACRDTLRLEAGMPLYGNELGPDRTPFEAGLGRVVRFDKAADFVGRPALLQRRDDPGGEVLVGLRGSGRRAARGGCPVLREGRPVGRITSGALSPTLGHPVAMAFVERGLDEPGTCLTVDVRGRPEPVDVVSLPFYRRS
ncbi:glycine cleavage system aminomethyltransferase GcvT [Pseudonocardia ailaonensis]|uniref:Aminomethyltransferase n=1 Tax=Pseudonocardia ailaonensis TaxID=367279 RepID=A0ABN2NP01_9PSEU